MTIQGLSTRPFARTGLIKRLNLEFMPVLRAVAEGVDALGFPVDLSELSDRPLEEETVVEVYGRQIHPFIGSLITQVNLMASDEVVTRIGAKVPHDIPALVEHLNRVVMPRLRTARNVVVAATP